MANIIDSKAKLDQCRRDANVALAKALGWLITQDSKVYPTRGIPPGIQQETHPDHRSVHRWHQVPDYCGDWKAIAPLIFRHDLKVEYMKELRKVYVHVGNGECVGEYFDEHGSDEAALRYAATLALTLKLKGGTT